MTLATPDAPPAAVSPGSLVGQVIADKYRLEALVGRGASGEVYRAVQLDLDREVALKLLVNLGDVDARERFLREAKITAGIHHPGVAEVYDTGLTAQGTPFYTMELLRGETLAEKLARGGRLPHAEAIPLVAGICTALQATHAKGFIHRDVKPSNIFLAVRSDGGHDPKLIDFGIAKQVPMADPRAPTKRGLGRPNTPPRSHAGLVVGTPSYLSPEQITGEPIDGRADVYGVGALLYEVLTGAPPFAAANTASLLEQILTRAPEPLATRAPDAEVPPAIERVMRSALAKSRDDRPASAAALAAALWSAAAEARAASREPTPVPTPPRRSGALLAILGLVAALALLAVVYVKHRPTEAPRPPPIAVAAAPPSAPPPAPPSAPAPAADPAPSTSANPAPPRLHRPAAAPLSVAASASPAPGNFRIDDLKTPFH